MDYIKQRYFKLKSVSWWFSVIPIVAGVVEILAAGIPALEPMAAMIELYTGGVAPALLINAGIAGVGFRGAMK